MTKPFDLVVHGATGFTGRLVVEYLLQRYPAGSGLRWAMGGRNADKLAAVRDEVGAPADTPLVVTDTSNPASLQALMDATRLVLTTVGPYQLYGNELVAACAKAGVDYVDLCGEPAWMRQMIDAHEAMAKASGADGMMVEVHPNPPVAMSDSKQQLSIPEFHAVMDVLESFNV